MKTQAVLALLFVLIVSCAPAAGRPAILYKATKQQVIDTIITAGQQITGGSGYNYFGVTGITESSVLLKSTPTTGLVILVVVGGSRPQDVDMFWTVVDRGNGNTSVAVNTVGFPGNYRALEDQFFQELDRHFARLTPNLFAF